MNSKTSICEASSTTRVVTGIRERRPQVFRIGSDNLLKVDRTRVIPSNISLTPVSFRRRSTSEVITASPTSSYNPPCLQGYEHRESPGGAFSLPSDEIVRHQELEFHPSFEQRLSDVLHPDIRLGDHPTRHFAIYPCCRCGGDGGCLPCARRTCEIREP